MNKLVLTGNLTKKPELHYTQSNIAYSKMTIAVARPYTSKSANPPPTDFFNLTAWNKTAEFCEKYFDKGSRILVEGRIANSTYTDQNGVKHYPTTVIVENIEFAGGKPANKSENEEKQNYSPPDDEDLSDIPFQGLIDLLKL